MNQQFQCTKIKDGLYLGNIVAAHDFQFLFSNKFGYVVNCTAEIPNVFQHENIRYLKFKLVDGKPHKLWDETLKKLSKLQKFLQQAEQASLCCLIHSFHGQNRSLVFVIGYLMKKYQWRLKKTLQFLKSKQIFIGLSNHYIAQLEILQQILLRNNVLSLAWTPPYINQQEEIISKTYLNSLEGKDIVIKVEHNNSSSQQQLQQKQQQYSINSQSVSNQQLQHVNNSNNININKPILLMPTTIQQPFKRVKKQKRIVWLDRLQKKKRKQQISLKKTQQLSKAKQKAATHIQTVKFHIPEYDMRDPQLIKNIQYNSGKRLVSSESVRSKDYHQQQKKSNSNKQKNNQNIQFQQVAKDQLLLQQQQQGQKNIYQLTINNFISPNFNIINKTQPIVSKKSKKSHQQKPKKQDKKQDKQKKNPSQRPTSAGKKSTQKINRAQSQKQVTGHGVKGLVNSNKQSIKQDDQTAESRQVNVASYFKSQKQSGPKKQKVSTLGGTNNNNINKQRDVKRQLKKEIEKVQREKGSHTSLHSLHPLSTLAQQLIKVQQQNGVKRASTPTRKERKKQGAK